MTLKQQQRSIAPVLQRTLVACNCDAVAHSGCACSRSNFDFQGVPHSAGQASTRCQPYAESSAIRVDRNDVRQIPAVSHPAI
eukprot:CAMPEP_0182831068 /NCGR_PEP_ID=MMETSP0006_2-20121128/18915_1 /TAXON_ID=97485 /ORGANISM="Prymnesium parvum, Strain Texoma1" /LENGTH=81 /DNA_ID=CAMNT_0024958685 /DNA_START=245 /DNA_END=491 /DNA_ORIENTATION=+